MKNSAAVIAALFITSAMLFVCAEKVFAITELSVDPYSTFAGSAAGESNTSSGDYNAFYGFSSGSFNDNGHHNTFVGSQSGLDNSSGSYNTFIGQNAGWMNETGENNTHVGSGAGHSNISSSNNTYMGKGAGYNNKGAGNVFIGASAGFSETNVSNKLYISNTGPGAPLIYGEFDNQIVEINGRLVFASDERLKKDIKPLEGSLYKVMRLNGVSFEWKDEGSRGKGRKIGFIAEAVEAVIPELVHRDRQGEKSISYDRFVPSLIGAIQEQQAMINKHKENIAAENLRIEQRQKKLAGQDTVIKGLAAQLASLRAEVDKLKSKNMSTQN
jgi:hypothetical protein